MQNDRRLYTNRYVPWLWLLTTLFCFRVVAQPATQFFKIPFLPSFQDWHTGAIPYWLLVIFQISIIGVMVNTNIAHSARRAIASRIRGRVLLLIGLTCATIMVARLNLGRTLLANHYWFANSVAPLFHLVLAAYILMLGTWHMRHTHQRSAI